jgi:hypothetical protein
MVVFNKYGEGIILKKLVKVLLCMSLWLSLPYAAFAYSNPMDLPESWTWDSGEYYGEGDPYILKHNGIYYLYVSTVDDKSGVKAWTSEDLMNWTYAGLVTEEPTTKAAYAPEVVYWNGDFYMYTSPGGNGHYVYKSSSPLGPFKKQTDNLGMGIDGHVFIDDDGKWYFYSTGSNRIDARSMPTPSEFGKATDTGAKMNGWTEGATVLKRHGKYYMTYTGNHIWNKAYRIDYGVSDSPNVGFTTNKEQNPLLLNTEGENVGLGHNTVVRGPDLDSDYIVYHSHANPGRNINFDRIAWNGEKMLVLGPTTSKQSDPALPDFSDRFNRTELGADWKNVNGGKWSITKNTSNWLEQKKLGDAKWSRQVSKVSTDKEYTAEFNLKMVEKGESENPRLGVVFSYKDEKNYGTAVLSSKHNRLETNFVVDGEEQGWEYADLPEGYDYTKLHQLRVERSGDTFRIYVDGMQKQTREVLNIGAGSIGYTTSDVHGAFSYTAFSNKVDGSNVFDAYKPLPGTIEAVHYNAGGEGVAYHDKTRKEAVNAYRQDYVDIADDSDGSYYIESNKKGEWLKYNVNIAEEGLYNLDLRVGESSKDAKIRILLDGKSDITGDVSIPPSTDWRTFSIEKLKLPKGKHTLTIEVVKGSFDFSSFKVQGYKAVDVLYDDFNDGDAEGWDEVEGTWKVGPFEEQNIDFDEYKQVPGVINAAYYNTGGEGVAYHDTTPENIGGVFRRDSVDIRTNPEGGGYAVGWNQTGEWLKYNVNVQEAGAYNLKLYAATTFTSAKARLWLDDKIDLTGVFDVPATGGWNNWQAVIKNGIKLPKGNHTLKLEFVEGEFDFTKMELSSFDVHRPLPGLIEAEDYNNGGQNVAYYDKSEGNSGGQYRNDDVDIRKTAAADYAVTSIETDEWLTYDVNILEEGSYGLDFLVSSVKDGSKIKLLLDDKLDLTGEIDLPKTGSMDSWKTVSLEDITLPAGQHTLKIVAVEGGFELSKFMFHQFDQYKKLPGRIMAADYITGGEGVAYHDNTIENIGGEYRQDAVDIRVNPEGGYNVGWNQTGEWLKYNVDIAEEGSYDLAINVATTYKDSQIRLWLDDSIDLTGVIDVPSTGDWNNWQSVIQKKVSLPTGQHTIKVEIVKGEFDFYYFEFLEEIEVQEPQIIGEYNASSETFAKSVIGEKEWKDYIIEADVKVAEGSGDGGVIFRVNNPANGIEYSQNNADFMQGYVAYINEDGVHLGKQNYNWEYLGGASITEPQAAWHHMKIEVIGTTIKVYVDDMATPKINFTDNSRTAFTQGKVGVRSNYNNTKFDHFLVRPYQADHTSIQTLLDMYKESGELKDSLYKSLSNKLKQSKKHLEKGKNDQAIKFLQDIIKLLHNDKKEVLKAEIERLIERL